MPDEDLSLNAPTTRRAFAKAAALAVAAPVLAPLAACAPAARTEPPPAPAPAPVAAPAAPVAPSAPAAQTGARQRQAPDPQSVHLAEALKARYGDRLTDEQWEEVRQGIEGNLRTARALRNFDIPIQTEPAFTFRAYRGGDR